jgi:hypothetical protein
MKINRTTLRDRCHQANTGIDLHLATLTSIPVLGSDKTPADIKTALQASIDAAGTTQNARGAWLNAVQTERALRSSNLELLSALKSFVILKFGKNDEPVLADFGFTTPRPAPKTVETKAAAVAKAQATRKARHTMGSRQKKKVKGTVLATPPPADPGNSTPHT